MNVSHLLPESLRKASSPEAPLNMRLMLAKGQLPLGFVDRLAVLAILEEDPDLEVRRAVSEGWASIEPQNARISLADSRIDADLLDLAAQKLGGDTELLIVILAHPNITAKTLARYTGSDDHRVLDRISSNQRVIVEQVEIIHELLKNPALDLSVAGRLKSLAGIIDEEAPPEEHLEPEAGGEDALVQEGIIPGFDGEIPEEFSQEIPQELLDDQEASRLDIASLNESSNIYKLIQTMSIAEKIKLATLGSKSARRLLARDSNRIVANAVIRSPKMQEDEVVPIAQDRTTPDDVIVYIMSRKDWMKNYQIRIALCKNPKTPLPKAMRLLESLNDKDLQAMGKNRNIPAAVAGAAMRMAARRIRH